MFSSVFGNLYARFCSCAGRFVSDLVGNHGGRFSRNKAHMICHNYCLIY